MKKRIPKTERDFFPIWIDPPFHAKGEFSQEAKYLIVPYVKFVGDEFYKTFRGSSRVVCEIKFSPRFVDPARSIVVGDIEISKIISAPKKRKAKVRHRKNTV